MEHTDIIRLMGKTTEAAAEYGVTLEMGLPAENSGYRFVFSDPSNDSTWEVIFWDAGKIDGEPILRVESTNGIGTTKPFFMSQNAMSLFAIGYAQ